MNRKTRSRSIDNCSFSLETKTETESALETSMDYQPAAHCLYQKPFLNDVLKDGNYW